MEANVSSVQLDYFIDKQFDFNGVHFEPDDGSGVGQSATFCLNNDYYTIRENPDDGYRSSMRDIIGSPKELREKLQPFDRLGKGCRVDARWEGSSKELIQFIDIETQKPVFSIGTRNNDDYYPSYVANFEPTNMSINKEALSIEEVEARLKLEKALAAKKKRADTKAAKLAAKEAEKIDKMGWGSW